MSDPLVSAICPTFNRFPVEAHLVEEAVESFLRQDHPNKELIILNDTPGQTLVCDAPGVRVINLPFHFKSLGEKYNLAIAAAGGSLIAPWEDDDLSLPHRLQQSVDHLGSAHAWNPQQVYYWEQGLGNPPRRDHGGVALNASIFRKSAWSTAGGFPAVSGNQDAIFDQAIRRLGLFPPPLHPDEQPAYIYRWGVSGLHLSSQRDTEAAYRQHGQKPITPGTFTIRPGYRPATEAVIRSLTA